MTFAMGGLFAWALEDVLARPVELNSWVTFACATAAGLGVLVVNAMRNRWIDRALPPAALVPAVSRGPSNDR